MIRPSVFTEEILYTTFCINVTKDGLPGAGTAFVYDVSTPSGLFVKLLITNRHVLDHAEGWSTRYHIAGSDGFPSGSIGEIAIDPSSSLGERTDHPDASVDLTGVFLYPILHDIERRGHTVFLRSLGHEYVPSDDELRSFTASESVIMVGYPTGLSDVTNNLPIFRHGATASHPAVDFNGAPEGLVDVACFPGSSGSPIIHFTQFFQNKANRGILTAGPRIWLLGVQVAVPEWTAEGRIETRPTPTMAGANAVPLVPQMMHLGYYIKARKVLELANLMTAAWCRRHPEFLRPRKA